MATHALPGDVDLYQGRILRLLGGTSSDHAATKGQLDAVEASAKDLANATGQLAVARASLVLTEVQTRIDNAVAALIAGAPDALNTLLEISQELAADQTALDGLLTTVGSLDSRLDAVEAATGAGPVNYKANVGGAAVINLDHNLNTLDVDVIVKEGTQEVHPVWTTPTANRVTLDFGPYTPGANAIRAVVVPL